MGINPRDQLSRLVSHLPDADVRATLAFATELASRHDPLEERLLAAPDEDEELAEHEAGAIREGLADRDAGRVYSSDEVKRELGV